MPGETLHLNLDDAWPNDLLGIPAHDATTWGPQLRFSAPPGLIEKFYHDIQPQLAPFLIYGSGDFHHLSALWARRAPNANIIVSFDNHPDWAITPPRWACGAWINRALELPHIKKISVWGCGNFECWWPGQIFGNRKAERDSRLEVHPWADDRSPEDRERRGAIVRENWREKFETFARGLTNTSAYVTIDMDCLRAEEAFTNWESGRFETHDVIWALGKLREYCRIVGGDICGAFSEPRYARWTQRFAANFDHPKLKLPSAEVIRRTNLSAAERIWPALIGN